MKGQAAMEFLLTYGWTILIIMLTLSGLAYLGVFSTDNITPDKCLFGTEIICDDQLVKKQGLEENVTILLNNGFATNIFVSSVNFDDLGEASGCGCASIDCDIGELWKSGETKRLNFKCTDDVDKINILIRITYKPIQGKYNRIIEGKLQSKVLQ